MAIHVRHKPKQPFGGGRGNRRHPARTRFAILRGTRVAQITTMNASVQSECALEAIRGLAGDRTGGPGKIGQIAQRHPDVWRRVGGAVNRVVEERSQRHASDWTI